MYIYIYGLFVTFLIRSFELFLGRAVLWVDVAVVTVVLWRVVRLVFILIIIIVIVILPFLLLLFFFFSVSRFAAIEAIDLLGRPQVWGGYFLETVGYWNAVLWLVAWFWDHGSGWLCISSMISRKLDLIGWPNWSCKPELLKISMAGEFKWAQSFWKKKTILSLISFSSRGSLLAIVNGWFCSRCFELSKRWFKMMLIVNLCVYLPHLVKIVLLL